MPFTDIDYIVMDIRIYHENRILVATYIQAFPLTDRVELGSVMLPDNLSVWIVLVSGLLDVLASAAIRLGLKLYIVSHRLG